MTTITQFNDVGYALYELQSAIDRISDITIGRAILKEDHVRLQQMTVRLANLSRHADVVEEGEAA